MHTESANRTRSRRWRSGTRRNKRHPITHIEVCSEPRICIIHNRRFTPPAEASRIRLTRCEQRWVDDVRAGRKHLHGDLKGSSKAMVRLRRVNTIRRHASAARIDKRLSATGRNLVSGVAIVTASNYAIKSAMMAEMDKEQRFAQFYGSNNPEAIRQEIQGLAMGTAQYGRGSHRDISDRWYPRGQ